MTPETIVLRLERYDEFYGMTISAEKRIDARELRTISHPNQWIWAELLKLQLKLDAKQRHHDRPGRPS